MQSADTSVLSPERIVLAPSACPCAGNRCGEAVRAEGHQPHSQDGPWITLSRYLIGMSFLTLFIKG